MSPKSNSQDSDLPCGLMSAGKAALRSPKFFTIAKVAEFLSLSRRSVRRLIDDHKLPVHRFGHAVRIAEADLRAFTAIHRVD